MNKETNDFLENQLNDAHNIFIGIIAEMKDNNIVADYYELESEEGKCYQDVTIILNKMNQCVAYNEELRMEYRELFEYEQKLFFKYFSLYIVSIAFIWGYHKIFDTSELNDIVKYIVGMFLGSAYVGLLSKDLYDNRNGTKEVRDVLNKLKTLREDYKEHHDKVVCEIDGIFKLNDTLYTKIDQEKVKNK